MEYPQSEPLFDGNSFQWHLLQHQPLRRRRQVGIFHRFSLACGAWEGCYASGVKSQLVDSVAFMLA
jgi:hypothetical protein